MESDSIILEGCQEDISGEMEQTPEAIEDGVKFCLNCGTEVSDKFCPHCGQSTSVPSKLKMKNFGKGLIMSFGRLTPGFFNTAKGLMLHPWEVIRDHIHGKHIRYSPPVTMVIQVFLYATILYTLLDSILGSHLTQMYNFEEGLGYKGENVLLRMIDQSIVFQTLFAGIPVCFAFYLGFYRHGARKYNFAEYLAAFIYMYSAIAIYDIVLNLIYLIPGIDFPVDIITDVIAFAFSIIVIVKAFPQNKLWKTILLFIWSGFLCVIMMSALYMIYLIMTRPEVIDKLKAIFELVQ